jgi:hypothetical protein
VVPKSLPASSLQCSHTRYLANFWGREWVFHHPKIDLSSKKKPATDRQQPNQQLQRPRPTESCYSVARAFVETIVDVVAFVLFLLAISETTLQSIVEWRWVSWLMHRLEAVWRSNAGDDD